MCPFSPTPDERHRRGHAGQHAARHDRALIQDEGETNPTVLEHLGDCGGSTPTTDLLIAPKRDIHRHRRLPSLLQELLHRLEDRDAGDLVVKRAATPHGIVANHSLKRRDGPSPVVGRNHIVVGHEQHRSIRGGFLLRPRVHHAKRIRRLPRQVPVHGGECRDRLFLPRPKQPLFGLGVVGVMDRGDPKGLRNALNAALRAFTVRSPDGHA